MSKNQNSFEKRRRELEKRRKAEEKRERRRQRKEQPEIDAELNSAADEDSDGND